MHGRHTLVFTAPTEVKSDLRVRLLESKITFEGEDVLVYHVYSHRPLPAASFVY